MLNVPLQVQIGEVEVYQSLILVEALLTASGPVTADVQTLMRFIRDHCMLVERLSSGNSITSLIQPCNDEWSILVEEPLQLILVIPAREARASDTQLESVTLCSSSASGFALTEEHRRPQQ